MMSKSGKGKAASKSTASAARFDKSAAAREELEKLLKVAVREYEDDFALRQHKNEAAKAGDDLKNLRTKKRATAIVSKVKEEQQTVAGEIVTKIVQDFHHPDHGATLQNTLNILSGNVEGVKTVDDLLQHNKSQFTGASGDKEKASESTDMDFTMATLLRQMAEIPKNMSGVWLTWDDMRDTGLEPAAVEQTGEDIMNAMTAEFERLGEKEDYEAFIESNLRQLLSKEIMYVPAKLICDKFPEWLAIEEEHLPKEEYIRFGRQYQHFQRMVACYETEPDNFPRLMEIMYDIQEYGTPPADIIKSLAPGLEFNEEGLPVMPNLPGNVLPHMPNVPFPESQVCVMC